MFKDFIANKLGLKIAVISVCLGLLGLVFSIYQARAADYNAGVLKIHFDGDQLFSATNLAPGNEIVKNITITNTGTLPHSFSITASKVSGSLADVLQIEPRDAGATIWNETLTTLAAESNGSKVILPSLAAGESKTIQIAVILPSGVGNDYQNSSTSNFTFVMGNESTDSKEPNYQSAPASLSLDQQNSGSGATAETSSNITGGSQSNGEQGTVDNTNDVKGVATTAKASCLWWLVVLVILALMLLSYARYIRDERPNFWYVWPVVMALAMYFVHYYIHNKFDTDLIKTFFCNYLWAFEALLLIAFYIWEKYRRDQDSKIKTD